MQRRKQMQPLTEDQRRRVWKLYKAGRTPRVIGRTIGRAKGVIRAEIYRHGGFMPRERRRSVMALTLPEREIISRGLAAHKTLTAIADSLGRAVSTVSREVARHGGAERYRTTRADADAWASAQRPKPCRLLTNLPLQRAVTEKLTSDWAPQQIAGWLKKEYRRDKSMQVSHETIYRSLFIQARGALKKELLGHLRTRRHVRRSRTASLHGHGRGQIVDAVQISKRPALVEHRAVPGHWEGDLMLGGKHSAIATLVERRSRFTLLVKIPSRRTADVVPALIRAIKKLPAALRRSLTWDRGLELADHAKFTVATDVKVYFCDPHSPWQRGSNENTNGLLRQYFPKGVDLTDVTQAELNRVALKLNTRPRATLGFETPASRLLRGVAMTG